MNQYIFAYLITNVLLALINFVYFAFIAKNFYLDRIGTGVQFSIPMLGLLCLIYSAGILFFVISPGLQVQENAWKIVLLMGCLFGFFCYATHGLSNLATLKDWSVSVAVLDIVWGVFLTGTVATLSYQITRYFFA